MILWGCNSCRIQHLKDWDSIIEEEENTTGLFKVLFIFTPNSLSPDKVPRLLHLEEIKHPVFWDSSGEFSKLNPELQQPLGRGVSLDVNNRIILVGSPLYNSRLWELYRRTIYELIGNGGTLPD